MCTGRPPFRAETTLGVLRRITDSQPRPIREVASDVPAWLCEIVEQLLAKDPDQRPKSADDVQALLGKWLAHVQQPNIVPAPARLSRRTSVVARKRALFAVLAAAIACGLLTAGLLVWRGRGPETTGRDTGVKGQIESSVTMPAMSNGSLANRVVDESQWISDMAQLRQDVQNLDARWSASEETVGEWDETMSSIRSQLDRLAEELRE
jgi:serine/threonine-protein kinase